MRERRVEDYYVGQEVWDIRYGKGHVIEVNKEASIICCYYDKHGICSDYQIDGKDHVHDVYPSLFFEEVPIPESASIPKRWIPKYKDKYRVIFKECGAFSFGIKTYEDDDVDRNNIFQNNFFRTDEEAQGKLDEILKLMKSGRN